MMNLKLKRHLWGNPEINEMQAEIDALYSFLKTEPSEEYWQEAVEAVLAFQEEKGGFALLDCWQIPSDIRVDFCYMPTYLCTAILMKAVVYEIAGDAILPNLARAMKVCVGRNLSGHGYDANKKKKDALNIFRCAHMDTFLKQYPHLCEEFTEMCDENEIKTVFVYGTLLENQSNHGFLKNAKKLGRGKIYDYALYHLGAYPGIVPYPCRTVLGEVYCVDAATLRQLDSLEGEGCLYDRVLCNVAMGNRDWSGHLAWVYVYKGEVEEKAYIPEYLQPYAKDVSHYIWYVAYGSNLLKERFQCYIKGGLCSYNGKDYVGCKDKTLPLSSVAVTIPFPMYFGNHSPAWNHHGVAFLDTNLHGETLGRAWLVTKEQYEEVWQQEGKSEEWYGEEITLEPIYGIVAKTFTRKNAAKASAPSAEYLKVIEMGKEELKDLS